ASTPSMSSLSTRFFGQPSVTRWTRRGSVTLICELDGDAEVGFAQEPHDRLEIVALLAADAQLIALDGDLDLQLRVLHALHHLARLVGGDALLEIDLLLGASRRAGLDRSRLQRLERHPALAEALAQDVGEGAHLEVVGRAQVERVLLASHLGRCAPEVEALADLAQRLVDRVVDLLEIDAADDVEGRHRAGLNRRAAGPRQPRAAARSGRASEPASGCGARSRTRCAWSYRAGP